jgi:hypothetical protein
MMGWHDLGTDFEMWARTQKYAGAKYNRIVRFRTLVEKLDRKQRDGHRLTAEDYVELSILASKMYSPGDYCAFPKEVRAALTVMLDNVGHQVSSG